MTDQPASGAHLVKSFPIFLPKKQLRKIFYFSLFLVGKSVPDVIHSFVSNGSRQGGL